MEGVRATAGLHDEIKSVVPPEGSAFGGAGQPALIRQKQQLSTLAIASTSMLEDKINLISRPLLLLWRRASSGLPSGLPRVFERRLLQHFG